MIRRRKSCSRIFCGQCSLLLFVESKACLGLPKVALLPRQYVSICFACYKFFVCNNCSLVQCAYQQSQLLCAIISHIINQQRCVYSVVVFCWTIKCKNWHLLTLVLRQNIKITSFFRVSVTQIKICGSSQYLNYKI